MHAHVSHQPRHRRTRWPAATLVVAITATMAGAVFPIPAQARPRAADPQATDPQAADPQATDPQATDGPPVVLVHGLNSTADTWEVYTGDDGFLASIGRRAFAVGDGQAPGTLDMGHWYTAVARTNTIAENAEILGGYIDAVRSITGATHVDIVAHSMGGLVSRYYIDHLMGERDVARLIMLGTPNEGSDCASLPAALGIGTPATLELRPAYVSEVFNRSVTDRNGVPFFVLAGTEVVDPIMSPCAAVPSDGVVSRASAVTVDAAAEQLPLHHIGLPLSRTAFEEFVAPVLLSEFDPDVFSAQPGGPLQPLDEQYASVAAAHVPPGGTAEVVVQLDSVAVAAFALFDPTRSVDVEVRGASGGVVELDPSRNGVTVVDDPAALVHLGYGFENPRPGPWRVILRATERTPAQGAGVALAVRTAGGATLHASTSTLLAEIGAPVAIDAQLLSGGQPAIVDSAVAVIRRPDGGVAEVALAIDGSVASGDWRPDGPGVHGIDVRLAGRSTAGQAVERVALLAVEVAPPAGTVWLARAAALAVLTLLAAGVTLLIRRWRRRIGGRATARAPRPARLDA